jgi:multiple sugar transport system substrate-binding protein
MKRLLIVSLLIFSLSLGLLFASGGREVVKPEKAPKLVMMFSSGGSGKTLSDSAKKFGEKSGIEMEVLQFPIKEIREKQILALSTKQATPDIIACDDSWFAEMKGFLAPLKLDSATKDAFVASMIGSFRWPPGTGDYLAVPVRMGGDVIMYREDVFAQKGVDPNGLKTWEDIYAAVKKLHDPGNRMWGWAQAFTPYNYLMTQFSNFMSSHKVKLISDDGKKATFNTKNGVQGTKMLVKLATEFAPPGFINFGYNEQVDAMRTGTVALSMVWSPRYRQVNDAKFPAAGKFKVLPWFPYGEGTGLSVGVPRVYGWGLGINKYSKYYDSCLDFLKFIGSGEEQLRLASERNNSPTVVSVFNHPDYLKAIPEADKMSKALKPGIARPVHSKWSEIVDTVGLHLQKAIVGDETVEEALASAEKKVNSILAD